MGERRVDIALWRCDSGIWKSITSLLRLVLFGVLRDGTGTFYLHYLVMKACTCIQWLRNLHTRVPCHEHAKRIHHIHFSE